MRIFHSMAVACTAAFLLSFGFFPMRFALADPVSEALEEARKLQTVPSGKGEGTIKTLQSEANKPDAGNAPAVMQKRVKEEELPGKAMEEKGTDLKNTNDLQEDADITPPDQKKYPNVINRFYKSGGNGEPAVFIYYPDFNIPAIDRIFKEFAENTARSFIDMGKEADNSSEEDSSSSTQMEMTGFFTLDKPCADIASVTFNIYDYTGGAHGQLGIIVFNYDLKDGRKIQFSDLFGNPEKALQLLSELSVLKLRQSLGDDIEEDMLKDGTEPIEENFSCLSLRPDGITVEFQPYQVGPWSIGQPHVDISLEELQSAKPNPEIWQSLKTD